MIQKLTVHKLWGRENFALEFHPDLNIFTGSNGSGKTTLLKLLWYLPIVIVEGRDDVKIYRDIALRKLLASTIVFARYLCKKIPLLKTF